MHEYSLSADEIRAFTMCHAKNATLHNISSMFEIKDWVVCRIFKKNRATKFDAGIKRRSTEFARFVTRQSNNQQPNSPLSSPSPSSSSCVTDLSDNGEENSSCNIDSSPRED
uniref:NAC domain-containing protein n=1 Tax=Ananas comosus var. bracteatus TaxID=296719 RepID=A0A6V7QVA4_ANACO